ncbi:hypothetical protein B9Q13_04445 [Candidatus Marsarchaeota G2 archaeon ECH_B_SAG-G16]|uniref:Uncharacterized protein n=1 Tax=Candidatus Marsarchaeota G2 archaeon ECH_B_SAG-G16 TaxID=1978167 RepID=A0A2R6C0V8_9ARCH|nr:MAG: hypothetical protein B9Q13_04445 [Candidatus Marsarchaeota G2 archaeon ECH_B_SAG-G16]
MLNQKNSNTKDKIKKLQTTKLVIVWPQVLYLIRVTNLWKKKSFLNTSKRFKSFSYQGNAFSWLQPNHAGKEAESSSIQESFTQQTEG